MKQAISLLSVQGMWFYAELRFSSLAFLILFNYQKIELDPSSFSIVTHKCLKTEKCVLGVWGRHTELFPSVSRSNTIRMIPLYRILF